MLSTIFIQAYFPNPISRLTPACSQNLIGRISPPLSPQKALFPTQAWLKLNITSSKTSFNENLYNDFRQSDEFPFDKLSPQQFQELINVLVKKIAEQGGSLEDLLARLLRVEGLSQDMVDKMQQAVNSQKEVKESLKRIDDLEKRLRLLEKTQRGNNDNDDDRSSTPTSKKAKKSSVPASYYYHSSNVGC